MKFRHELPYDASPAEVFEMLADPAFREAVAEAQDVISADVQLERDGDGFTLVIDQVQKTDDLPGFARTFAGDSTQAIQREDVAGRRRGGDLRDRGARASRRASTGTIRLRARRRRDHARSSSWRSRSRCR